MKNRFILFLSTVLFILCAILCTSCKVQTSVAPETAKYQMPSENNPTDTDEETEREQNLVPPEENKDSEPPVIPHSHEYSAEITIPATCTEPGVKTFTCSCGDFYTEEIPAGHKIVKFKAKTPTCTQEGYEEYEKCTECGYTTKKTLPVVSHVYENGKCNSCGKYDLDYTIVGTGYTVTRYEGTETTIYIEDEIGDTPVTVIAENAFKNCRNITEVKIGGNVKEIGKSAFSGCGKLKTIIIPDKVTQIEQGTFDFCSSLEEITLPAGITLIDYGAFNMCRKLKTVRFKGTVSEWYSILIVDDLSSVTVICSDGNA